MPPLVGVAVHAIDAPVQVGFEPDVTAVATVGTIPLDNDITMAFEVNAVPEVMMQVTVWLVNVVDVYVNPVSPLIRVPFKYHWYLGLVPPLVGDAVNVIDCPEHVGFVPPVSAIVTEIPEQPQAERLAVVTNELLRVFSVALVRADCPAVNILVQTSEE